jgi:hypothetical protein
MWRETEIFIQEKKLLCDSRQQRHHRLDNYWPLSDYTTPYIVSQAQENGRDGFLIIDKS